MHEKGRGVLKADHLLATERARAIAGERRLDAIEIGLDARHVGLFSGPSLLAGAVAAWARAASVPRPAAASTEAPGDAITYLAGAAHLGAHALCRCTATKRRGDIVAAVQKEDARLVKLPM